MLKLYEAGSEGPQWWGDAPDPVRGLPAAGILDRCTASHTCPKIIEHFGAAEVWGLKLTPEWVGTAGDADLPLPDNVRRYYIPSTQHGGGRGRLQHRGAGATGLPELRLGQGRACRQSDAAYRDRECHPGAFPQLGHEGRGAAAEPLSDACAPERWSMPPARPWASRRCRACRRTRRPASSIR